jgi:ubiquinone/menaquinone biosynthesis C-methylase UbiE
MDTESAVRERYAAAAQAKENSLCCAVDYDAKYLEAIPAEVIERDYGCGDPSQHLREGETVLDLGSGTGKICFIAAQVVGPGGRVIGVDMTDEMLEIARRNAPLVAEKISYENVEFRKGRIQDLALDFELLEGELKDTRLDGLAGFLKAEAIADKLRTQSPMVADGSVDVVVSNCVLNLVAQPAKRQLFGEVFRVLKPGGRAVISDIVSNADVSAEMQADEELWSGCISGALREDKFLRAFAEAGFEPVRILSREEQAWREHGGIEFRSMTVEAIKPATENARFFMPQVAVSPAKKCC